MRAPIFTAIRTARGKGFTNDEVKDVDALLDKLGIAREAAQPPAEREKLSIATPAAGARRINVAGLALIKKWEGLRLTAYLCPAKVWTIGYGSTGPHVKQGMTITEARAEELLREDLERFEQGVAKAAPNATDNQFAAMVSLAFNVGLGSPAKNIPGFLTSTVLKRHLVADHAGAAAAFAMWNKAGGKVLPGLVSRRAEEAALYRRPA